MNTMKTKGFTLLELAVVIGVVGIIVATLVLGARVLF